MACCYTDDNNHCGKFCVTPMLDCADPARCSEDTPLCFSCIPQCPVSVKPQRITCAKCERRSSSPPKSYSPKLCENCACKCEGSPCLPVVQPQYCTRRCYPCTEVCLKPVEPIKTKYVIPCYRYEDGRIVRKLPVSAFKRNGMQDQEHSKMLGTTNFLKQYPDDVMIECEVDCP